MADDGMAVGKDGGNKKKVRMYLDGCFDLVHYGHANACRQAKQLGDHLIVGLHPDHDLSFTADGRDTHEHLRQAGRFKNFKRTSFISTTDLVGRILLMTQTHHGLASQRESSPVTSSDADLKKLKTFQKNNDVPVTANLIQSFSTGRRPEPEDKIVYAPGNYDLLHIGHVNFLEAASKEGGYLLVGLYHDCVIQEKKGLNFPIMGLLERALNLLSLRYVSDVLIGAPEYLTPEFLKTNKISLVVRGDANIGSSVSKIGAADPLEEAKKMGIFKMLESGSSVRTKDIIWRIVTHRPLYERRNAEKQRKEEAAQNILKKRMEVSSETGYI
ncbi:ethanolamine-phosphate cytidylyltransferase-like isoform X2 [Lineus longissimus]|uniref:ethanolamine-phosphate cytidylyltransferase-like isoform X2 n=1 Tax=Lineus longissimus TaxID=88925 RepID=UPI00315C796E